MSALSPRVTKQRVLGGLAFAVVAAVIMYLLGADMQSLLVGMVIGFALVAAVAALVWTKDRREVKSASTRGETS